MSYTLHRGVNRPIEFLGLQAQYINYLGLVSLGMLLTFAGLYLLGVPLPIAVIAVLGSTAVITGYLLRLSHRYGVYGLMKAVASRKVPAALTPRELDERLPIWGVENGCLLSRTGDLTVVLTLNLPEIFSLSQAEYERLHEAWVKVLHALPPNTVLHKQDWFVKRDFAPREEGRNKSEMDTAADRHFLGRPSLEHDAYLCITQLAEGRRLSTSATSNLLRPSIVPSSLMDPRRLQAFLDAVLQVERILVETGLIGTERLGEPGLLRLVERYCFLQEGRLQRDITFKESLRIGGQHAQLYTLSDPAGLPQSCSPWVPYTPYATERTVCPLGFASPLAQHLDCNHIYNQCILVGDGRKTIRDLERRLKRLQSLSTYSRGNAVARDAVDTFLQEAAKEQRLPVKAHYNLLVYADSHEDVRQVRSLAGAALSRMNVVLKEETLGAPQLFWACIPGNAGDLPVNETFDTFAEQAVCFLNQETRYRSSRAPMGIRLGDRLTGTPVHVNLSDELLARGICGNLNKIVFGPSGSGKSNFTAHMVRSYYDQGAHVLVLDIGHSYEGLCRLLGGYYFTYDGSHSLEFNPFFIEGGGAPDDDKREAIRALLLVLSGKDQATVRRTEEVALMEAITTFYAYLALHPDVFPCFDAFYTFLREDFALRLREQKVREQDVDLDGFLYVLRPYYAGGEFDTLLNGRGNLDLLGERCIVFELDAIKDSILFPVVTLIIMEVILAKIRRLPGKVKKLIVIEEAWKALAKEGMSEYIKGLFKTIRKSNGEAVVVTQEVEDIISSNVVKDAILNNADIRILLDQGKYLQKFEPIKRLLGLTDKEEAMVLSLNKANEPGRRYKEVFLSLAGRISQVYRVELSPEEYWTYTTQAAEKAKVKEAVRLHGSMRHAIRALAGTLLLCLVLGRADAQIPGIGIVGSILKKIINAMDIKVQQLQLETLDLQDAQKATENDLSHSELSDIMNWVQQERDLYSEYYNELWQVKEVLSTYDRVRDILRREQQAAQACRQAMVLFRRDDHFSQGEIQRMTETYNALLEESTRNLDELTLLVTGNTTQMSDGRRLTLIDEAAWQSETDYNQVQSFTQTQVALSLRRARDQQDLEAIEQLYGLP
ncbi:TraG family conjugative transposon ATPase [Dinghuibacter silviterrae]|uniref:Conjugation system TraG family ATPase n=1 Tax=Dinghuibacter silviterrae TaxID=1539049 RepID=A0A4R8DUJ3_9BACT|nr:TraG family conjugative transposon ATPase [Dinghuibacter silviterrae]TDX01839.1 conjugation system TraG family ATPase [Dinghuibacter silviterrae]